MKRTHPTTESTNQSKRKGQQRKDKQGQEEKHKRENPTAARKNETWLDGDGGDPVRCDSGHRIKNAIEAIDRLLV
jgi:hypothetical protein